MDMSRQIAFSRILIVLAGFLIFPADRPADELIGAAERGQLDKVRRLLDQVVPMLVISQPCG
jgi:hypothetical protein